MVAGPAPARPRPAGGAVFFSSTLLIYLGIGLASVGLDVGLLVGLHTGLGLDLAFSTTAAFAISLAFNFGLNRRFMSTGAAHLGRHALRYGLLVGVNYVITLGAVTAAAGVGVSYVVAKLAVVAASTVWNFLLYRYWVFAPRRGSLDRDGLPTSPGPEMGRRPPMIPEPARLLVVIPAYNEADSIGLVLNEVAVSLPEADTVVVDDASSDGTRARALAAGASVLTLPFNLGVGGAVRAGFRFAVRHGYTQVLQIDGDGQHDPREARLLLAGLNEADLVIGARFAGRGDYAVRGPRRWAMQLLSVALSRTARTRLSDTTSGFRANGPRAVQLFAQHYPAEYLGDTVETIVLAARAGLRIRQVPVQMRERAGGRPSQTPWRATWYLLRACLALGMASMRWPEMPIPEIASARQAPRPAANRKSA